jgi:hypothetical protein
MNAAASRLLAPAIVVLLAAGIVSAALVGGDDDAAAPATTTTTTPDDDADDEVEVEVATTASTSTSSTTTTSTTAPGATTSAPPAAGATTATTAPGSAPPAATTSAPAGPADLILHTNRFERVGRVRFSVENAGPGTAPGIVVTLTGAPGAVLPGDGVTCEGGGTVTCRVAATGTGGLIGFVELEFADGCPQVVASVASTVDDPDPASNRASRGLC